MLELTRDLGIGAQFGGKYFCHDVRVVRLPRHGAVVPRGDRRVVLGRPAGQGRITADGVFLEELETRPGAVPARHDRRAPRRSRRASSDRPQPADGRDPRRAVAAPGPDAAVADRPARRRPRHRAREDQGACSTPASRCRSTSRTTPSTTPGPAKTPEGYASGSFGPTTAGGWTRYVDQFQAAGGSLVMLAKGNRSEQVTDACRTHGGFYLGSIGGPAARLAQDCIKKVEVLEYPELGMEAVWRIEVRGLPGVRRRRRQGQRLLRRDHQAGGHDDPRRGRRRRVPSQASPGRLTAHWAWSWT